MSASTTCELSTLHSTTILFSKLSERIGDMLAISGVEKECGKRLLVSSGNVKYLQLNLYSTSVSLFDDRYS